MALDQQLPVDPNVHVPPAVARAAELAAAVHKQAYGDQPITQALAPEIRMANQPADKPADQPIQIAATPVEPAQTPPVEPAKPADNTQAVQPSPVPPTTPAAPAESIDWEARYNSMKGRVEQKDQILKDMQTQMGQLGNEVINLQRALQQPRQGRPVAAQMTKPLLTEEDVKTYGADFLDVVARAARQAVRPDLVAVAQEVEKTKQEVKQVEQKTVFDVLNQQLPNWDEINQSDRFKAWCSLRDGYSNELRATLLQNAFRQGDASRVLRFFNGFLTEEQATGHIPAPAPAETAPPQVPPREAPVQLGTLVAPGRAHPAPGQSAAAEDTPVFTRAQIQAFYRDVNAGRYANYPQEKDRIEAAIFKAQGAGRVRQ